MNKTAEQLALLFEDNYMPSAGNKNFPCVVPQPAEVIETWKPLTSRGALYFLDRLELKTKEFNCFRTAIRAYRVMLYEGEETYFVSATSGELGPEHVPTKVQFLSNGFINCTYANGLFVEFGDCAAWFTRTDGRVGKLEAPKRPAHPVNEYTVELAKYERNDLVEERRLREKENALARKLHQKHTRALRMYAHKTAALVNALFVGVKL